MTSNQSNSSGSDSSLSSSIYENNTEINVTFWHVFWGRNVTVRRLIFVLFYCFTDVDECVFIYCEHNCMNNVGSYECTCRNGYVKNGTANCDGKNGCVLF